MAEKSTGHLDYADAEDWHHIASLAKAKELAICPQPYCPMPEGRHLSQL